MVGIDYESNLADVRSRIKESAFAVGLEPADITLVAVSKTQSTNAIHEISKLGVVNFGENKAQELIEKAAYLEIGVKWHFVGKIQSNKIKKIAQCADLIQSIDSKKQIEILSKLEISPPILIQLSADGDPNRGGVTINKFEELLDHARNLDIDVQGVMHVPPLDLDPQSCFEKAKLCAQEHKLNTVSMGMTADFELAIRHGATMIRVGNAIFGPREYK